MGAKQVGAGEGFLPPHIFDGWEMRVQIAYEIGRLTTLSRRVAALS